MRHIERFSAVADDYDGFIIDLWGVIHDGVRPYPGALDVLRRLQGRPVLLLSNAPRRAWSAQRMLRRMGIDDGSYTAILTSGEATWLALRDRTDPWFARLGRRVYHLGPERDRNVLDGLDLVRVASPEEAEFVLNTGPDDERDTQAIESFSGELAACLACELPMICANPDLVVMRAGKTILCAGALAERYAGMGGDVRSIGKPDAGIYALALAELGLPASRVLAVGDSLRTDIAGAELSGLPSLWVLGGIHAADASDRAGAAGLAAASGLAPTAAIDCLCW